MATREQPITSEQMYRIEDNGFAIFGMKKILMMENAGHGLADFIFTKKGPEFAGGKILSFWEQVIMGEMPWLLQGTYQDTMG